MNKFVVNDAMMSFFCQSQITLKEACIRAIRSIVLQKISQHLRQNLHFYDSSLFGQGATETLNSTAAIKAIGQPSALFNIPNQIFLLNFCPTF